MTQKVLIVEDDPDVVSSIEKYLEEFGIESESVSEFDKLQKMIRRIHAGAFDAITMDGRIIKGFTGDLIPEIVAGFDGPVIAASGTHQKALMDAGCTHEAEDKGYAAKKVIELLQPVA